MGKKKVHHEEHVDETWLIPYADMLTLLLALFIVMFAMSQVDKEKLQQLSEQFSVIFSGGTGLLKQTSTTMVPNKSVAPPKSPTAVSARDPMEQLQSSLNDKVKEGGYTEQVDVNMNQEGLEITIQDVALFDSGKATVLENVKPLLIQICGMLKPLDNSIRISGHTDNIPIKTRDFRSNWDLSAMRAINVLNYMVDFGGLNPNKLSIQAYGEYKPKFDNSTVTGRAGNRRIEIQVIRNGAQNLVPTSVNAPKTDATPAGAGTTAEAKPAETAPTEAGTHSGTGGAAAE